MFSVYTRKVSRKQISKRVNGMAAMLYILGLCYRAVEIVLHSLGMGIGKTSVYRAVQTVAELVPGLKREKLLGEYKTKAVCMRNLFMDRWNLGPRLTFYRTWKDEDGNEVLADTNNHCERALGWWIKRRYRSMRGYKQRQIALEVSRLIASVGNHLAGGLRLAEIMA